MGNGKWARRALEAITEASASSPDLFGSALLEKIDAAYPFGERERFPYKVWLRERRAFIARTKPDAERAAEEIEKLHAACSLPVGPLFGVPL